jgi:hypothetical protein
MSRSSHSDRSRHSSEERGGDDGEISLLFASRLTYDELDDDRRVGDRQVTLWLALERAQSTGESESKISTSGSRSIGLENQAKYSEKKLRQNGPPACALISLLLHLLLRTRLSS